MIHRTILTLCLLLVLVDSAWAGPEEDFATVVAAILRGDKLIQDGKDRQGLDEYRKAQDALVQFKKIYPQWDTEVVAFRSRYLSDRLGKWPGIDQPAEPASDAETQALRNRINFLERSGQQYQAQVNQLVAENNRLSTRLREALAIRPAAQEPAAVAETQTRLQDASKQIEGLRARIKELETTLAGIPKPEEARQNARSLAEVRKQLTEALDDAEVLRKQNEVLRASPKPAAATKAVDRELATQLQAALLVQHAAETELQRVQKENDKLRLQLEAVSASARLRQPQSTNGATLKGSDRARLALAEGRVADAIALLNEELRAKPGQAESWYLLGRAQATAGDFAAAEKAQRRAVELAPGWGTAHLEMGRLFARRTQPDLALARWHYHKAIQLDVPRDALFEREISWEPAPAGN